MPTKFNSPIERLGHTSGITGWGWLFIVLVIFGLLSVSWFGYVSWQQKNDRDRVEQVGDSEKRQTALAYIRSIEQQGGNYYVTIDYLEWLTGLEAQQQAQADGLCQANTTDCVTNGFYLRNITITADMVLLNQQATILMQTLSTTASGTPQWDESISLDRWLGLFADPDSRWHSVPFRLAVDDNEVMSIREQYLP